MIRFVCSALSLNRSLARSLANNTQPMQNISQTHVYGPNEFE